MSAVLTAVAAVICFIALVPLAILIVELLAGLPAPRTALRGASRPYQVAVLIPAHDEEHGIAETIAALARVAPAQTRIVVIADNCTDQTAQTARAAGAEVIERQDPERRGKGYALAFGRDHLAKGPSPEVVVVLDADCRLLPVSVEALCETALSAGVPAQAINLIAPDLAAPPMVQISSFAMVVKNLFRSRGMQRLGGAALLTGTGMAFPWPIYATADLATGSIVEDLALGIEMTRQGHAPKLVANANVRSAPAAIGDALQQRKRWEHGFLDVLRRRAVPLLAGSMKHGRRSELFLGLHLLVPPLALTIAFAILALALCLACWALGGAAGPALALAIALAISVALLAIAWFLRGREFLSGRAVLRAPLYILWKLPVYASFLRAPERAWTRTKRPHE